MRRSAFPSRELVLRPLPLHLSRLLVGVVDLTTTRVRQLLPPIRELTSLLLTSLLLALPLHPLGLLRELSALLREALVALLLVPGSRYREALRTDEQEVGSSAGWVHVPRAVFM